MEMKNENRILKLYEQDKTLYTDEIQIMLNIWRLAQKFLTLQHIANIETIVYLEVITWNSRQTYVGFSATPISTKHVEGYLK